MNSILLLLLVILPFAGAIVGAFLPTDKLARWWALGVCIATAAVAFALLPQFQLHQDLSGVPETQRIARTVQVEFGGANAVPDPNNLMSLTSIWLSFHLGMDTISLWLVLLTVILQPLAIAASFESIRDRARQYYAWMLVLLGAMIGCFIARDVLLFYIFFELTLIPMFFIIGMWGGPERRYAAGKFFLFTFAGSVFTLAGVIYLGIKAESFDLLAIMRYAQDPVRFSANERFWVFLAFLAGFAVKVPLFPVHTWLPLAHTEAPTAGSVILAGVLLKLGTYGLLRFAVPLGLPDATEWFAPILGVLCIVGIIYGALVAWVQQDVKKLVAYSSVSHLGFCVLGLAALNDIGIQGSVLYMINHGLSTGALFLVVGMIYDRFHTRDMDEISGLARRMPKLAFFFVLFALSSIALPGLNGFVSEFLTLLGAFTSEHLGIGFAVFAAIGVILGAIYILHMVARVIWGPLKYPHGGHAGEHQAGDRPLPVDINGREVAVLVPIAILVVLLGVQPNIVLKTIAAPVELLRQPLAVEPFAALPSAPDTTAAPVAVTTLAEDRRGD